jgi:hypothetical protein
MKIFDAIDQIDNFSGDTLARTSRREAFRAMGSFSKKAAAAMVPFGLATAAAPAARADGHDQVVDVLNFALLLEYLEAEFYVKGLDSGVIPAGSDAERIYHQISRHETAHVELLKGAISDLGGTPGDKPEFDFTAGGLFNPFHDYQVYLILSQAFEDTGVRAYKGQAANLISNNAILTVALQIHSVEARHASEVRRLRGLKGWITQAERGAGVPEVAQATYAGEDNLVQAGVDVSAITQFSTDAITEAYDEPLSKEEVTAIATLFLA